MPAVEEANQITVHRASDLGDKKVKSCTIQIGEDVSTILGREMKLAEAELVYGAEAVRLADALVDHLPQATLDRVLLRLMERKVSKTSYYRGPLS